jgi:hypothetical protein
MSSLPITSIFSESNGENSNTSKKIFIKKRPDIKRSPDIKIEEQLHDDLGKRKLADSFGSQIYNDKERYNQDIPADFFKTNIGHNVYQDSEAEILDWCYKYLASKKK